MIKDKILIYTDGACSGNPGPMGIGIILLSGTHKRKISKYLGLGTNNIAELSAILESLNSIKDKDREIEIYTDSMYCIGLFTKNWKPKKNVEIIDAIKEKLLEFKGVEFKKVKGHSDNLLNNEADRLAVNAAATRIDCDYYV